MTILALPEVTTNPTQDTHFNNIQQAMAGDLLPRDSDGDATDLAGDLGTSALPWLKMNVRTGHLATGVLVPWYDFAGLLTLPQGYMLCNGDQITRAKYNQQHRTGVGDATDYWAIYIASTELENLYLPGGDGRFMQGTTSATEDGTLPLTEYGAVGSLINLAHDHGGALNTDETGNAVDDYFGGKPIVKSTDVSHHHTVTVPSALTTQDVTPVSIDVKYLMRIVE